MPKGIHDNPNRGRYERTAEHRAAKAEQNTTHGLSHTPTYGAWAMMIQRCTNPKRVDYPNCGGRGITVCERWQSFENFLSDMGEKPDGMVFRLRDQDGNYEPGNCEWRLPRKRDPEYRKSAGRARYLKRKAEDPEFSRWVHLRQRYGVDRESFETLVASQDGRCYLCDDVLELDIPRRVHMDHDHDCCPSDNRKLCGKCVRGLSCEACNKAIGLFRDDPKRIRRIADNLEAANLRIRSAVAT